MKLAIAFLITFGAFAEVRVDNVLIRMVPPGTESLMGGRMQELKSTALFEKLVYAQKLPDFERFVKETGFDPRTDVQELLFASTPKGGVLLARGKFRVKVPTMPNLVCCSTGHRLRQSQLFCWSTAVCRHQNQWIGN